MLEFLKNIFSLPDDKQEKLKTIPAKKLQVATCALFIEIAKADSSIEDVEREKIILLMKKIFDLEEDYVKELMTLASERVEQSISLYEFTPVINESFTPEDKYALLKNLWRLVYADNELDKYEEHLVKKIGKMINVEYKDIIAARIQVKNELNIQ